MNKINSLSYLWDIATQLHTADIRFCIANVKAEGCLALQVEGSDYLKAQVLYPRLFDRTKDYKYGVTVYFKLDLNFSGAPEVLRPLDTQITKPKIRKRSR